MVDPFELHPNTPELKKKHNNILTLDQIHDTIRDKMIEVGTEQEPKWGWDRHTICALLTNLMIELEDKCQNN